MDLMLTASMRNIRRNNDEAITGLQYCLHIRRKRRLKVHCLSGYRMGKGKSVGVQRLSSDTGHIRIVEIVSD